jgi:hypothetical protein
MLRYLAAVLAAAALPVFSQTISPSAQQVQLLAPQLVTFAGSGANFESLVNGLTQGTPVTLTTVSPDGFVQIVTFQPGSPLSALDAARTLETARQNLIGQGIGTPNAQQLATALVGGTLPTLTGTTPITGVLAGAPGTVQVRNEVTQVTGPGAPSTLNLSSASLQALRAGLAQRTPVTLTGTSPGGALESVTFTSPRALSAFEVNQALQLASVLLAQQGIFNPTVDQVRVALLGGNLAGLGGALVPVQGVLQGAGFSTSSSPFFGTSNSPFFGTSDSRPAGVNAIAPAAPQVVPERVAPRRDGPPPRPRVGG